jgi:hypothetical protein
MLPIVGSHRPENTPGRPHLAPVRVAARLNQRHSGHPGRSSTAPGPAPARRQQRRPCGWTLPVMSNCQRGRLTCRRRRRRWPRCGQLACWMRLSQRRKGWWVIRRRSMRRDRRYEPVNPPVFLFLGTAACFLPFIQTQGLVKGRRHQIHLFPDVATARQVGQRHGR